MSMQILWRRISNLIILIQYLQLGDVYLSPTYEWPETERHLIVIENHTQSHRGVAISMFRQKGLLPNSYTSTLASLVPCSQNTSMSAMPQPPPISMLLLPASLVDNAALVASTPLDVVVSPLSKKAPTHSNIALLLAAAPAP
ncbi:hypothetical protein AAHA92_00509 [Salvia divinorum]|uniref:Uncharacterized protein n=1 Tax=Salvia divinorum TaxID=28513 RepID=A0ABD1IJU5_SALDI